MQEEKGLRIIRNGLLLGEIKKNRFEPSQALAMALKLSDYPNVINLDVKDERVVKYLKGETLDCDDFTDVKDGWVLIGVSGYPLGWGKFKNGQVKNKYLAGWRWM
jgi:NOL1/NOP2/fmu family ribosome biogenesis protein